MSLHERFIYFVRHYYILRHDAKGTGMKRGRPKKNEAGLIGRAGRQAIELEDLARESRRRKSRKATIEKLRETTP